MAGPSGVQAAAESLEQRGAIPVVELRTDHDAIPIKVHGDDPFFA
jgi:hypothetical protein